MDIYRIKDTETKRIYKYKQKKKLKQIITLFN